MSLLSVMELLNYALVLAFGLFLSTAIVGGCENAQQRWLEFALYPVLLLVQGIFWLIWGVEKVVLLYPLIAHLPLVLILVFAMKKSVGASVVGVCTAYLCCQLPHWMELTVTALSGSALAGQVGYTLCIIPVFFLLYHWFAGPAHSVMSCSKEGLFLFGSLPVAYYLFDYLTFVYAEALHINIQAIGEFLPTALIIFYMLFLTTYHLLADERQKAELQRSMMEVELKQSETEMENLRQGAFQSAVYRHDIRHHMAMLDSILSAGDTAKAREYIRKVCTGMDAVTPHRFCENETVNLLCSAFQSKADAAGVELKIDAKLPGKLGISDTELCSVISNGLENALQAVCREGVESKTVEFYSEVRHGKLLMQIRNPYSGSVAMMEGVPTTDRPGHGYGCRSIQSIIRKHQGLCSFEPQDGIFTLRIILPAEENIPAEKADRKEETV